jgi:hypothetical protein
VFDDDRNVLQAAMGAVTLKFIDAARPARHATIDR